MRFRNVTINKINTLANPISCGDLFLLLLPVVRNHH